MKKIVTVFMVAVMVFCMTACGIADEKILGDWTVKQVNGQPVQGAQTSNIKIEKDGKITFTSAQATQEMTYTKASNGIEVKEKGKDEIYMSMLYDDAKATLTYKVNISGTEFTFLCEKGTTDLSAAQAQPATDAAQ